MATIVHAADLHIDGALPPQPGTYSLPAAEIRAAIRRAVEKLVDLTLTEAADLLIIAGDVFDRRADSGSAGEFFAAQMGRLREAAVPVLVTAGNHDVVCPLATGWPSNVHWFPADAATSVIFDDLGVAVHGQSLADPTEPADLAAGYPAPIRGFANLGMLHTSLDGSASKSICAPTSLAGLAAAGYDYWALGHVHERRVITQPTWAVFPGILQGRCPAEHGPKGATVLTTVGDAVVGVDHREVAVLRWEQLPLPAADGVDETLTQVSAVTRERADLPVVQVG
ncbi:DNA repair exonuclease [Natronosporangium hydrolyticum]|uniref:DNA repair exonuclease n=1 Tax=Natronosporangium hydrolyticum TaxID=2811111 RepID=A0A895YCV2_9ACTN|nr:DNA repair exonuclease [Natronosporangium hydrolyticum]QSB15341.1 DNA repair exonuclease [Natronosporangium hydrolyticum]